MIVDSADAAAEALRCLLRKQTSIFLEEARGSAHFFTRCLCLCNVTAPKQALELKATTVIHHKGFE